MIGRIRKHAGVSVWGENFAWRVTLTACIAIIYLPPVRALLAQRNMICALAVVLAAFVLTTLLAILLPAESPSVGRSGGDSVRPGRSPESLPAGEHDHT